MPPRIKNRLENLLNKLELPVKKLLFNCRNCGSCLLSQTSLICPMKCPKGLRNGPCGGTLDGMCEVRADRPCVWTNIKMASKTIIAQPIHAPFSPSLLGTSSYYNFLTGLDLQTREPIPFIKKILSNEPRTNSPLERTLLKKNLTFTCEIRSPSKPDKLQRLEKEINKLLPWIDAFNATSNHGGRQTIASLETALLIQRLGGDPILQICGRDVDIQNFLFQISKAYNEGIANILCLTGDWPLSQSAPPSSLEEFHRRFFPMDSSQMIHELHHIREKGRSAFGGVPSTVVPKFFIGSAANPHSTPRNISISRMLQKIACGVDFVQTQVVTDAENFCGWITDLEAAKGPENIHLLASIPIIATAKGLELLKNIKGVHVPDELYRQFRDDSDIQEAGLSFAKSIIKKLIPYQTVRGFHLTNFGAEPEQMIELIQFAEETARNENKSNLIPQAF